MYKLVTLIGGERIVRHAESFNVYDGVLALHNNVKVSCGDGKLETFNLTKPRPSFVIPIHLDFALTWVEQEEKDVENNMGNR